ncbi:hypothetical protein [Microbacterium panaciterrae]|uniref:Uncharacterized protein n=1 Tax=Microbacterium panaciterrae TaxID=985759 RepID=A0ABP8PFS5_9MICO
MVDTTPSPARGVSRRSLVKGAAWSVPVIAVAAATPLAAASTATNVGNFSLDGTCGVLGVLGPGFTLTAGAVALPVGTVINITGSGIANIGVFSVTGGTANVNVLSPTSAQITLTAPLAAGATAAFRTTLSISVAFGLSATLTLPSGFVAGPTAKATGGVNATLVLCSSN